MTIRLSRTVQAQERIRCNGHHQMSRKKPYVTEKMNYTMSAVNFSSKASEFRAEACQNIDDVSTRQKQKFL